MNYLNRILVSLILCFVCSYSVSANHTRLEFPNDSSSSYGSVFKYNYSSSALDLNSETTMLYDQALDQYILIANMLTRNLRIVFLDNKFNIVMDQYYPEKSDALPYSLHSINFYPSQYVSPELLLPGKIIIETLKGNLVINLKTRESKFLFFSKYIFDSRNNEIPVKEIKK